MNEKFIYLSFTTVVSIEFSPLSKVELTTNWYQLHKGDYEYSTSFPTPLDKEMSDNIVTDHTRVWDA